jgi:hypothetical protein
MANEFVIKNGFISKGKSIIEDDLVISGSTLTNTLTASTVNISTAFTFTSGATDGYVLTSDAFGNATWQELEVPGVSAIYSEINNFTQNVTVTINHNLNTTNVLVQIIDTNTNELIYGLVDNYQLNSVDVTLSEGLDDVKVVVAGGTFVELTGSTINTFTSGVTFNGNVLEFNRNDESNAYSIDLSDKLRGSFGVTVDGAGTVLTTGEKGYAIIPYDGTITGWSVISDQVGDCVMDVWKTSGGTIPTVSDTITGTEKPTLSSQQINSDLTLTSWITSVSIGDVIAFNIDSVSAITRINLSIYITKQ